MRLAAEKGLERLLSRLDWQQLVGEVRAQLVAALDEVLHVAQFTHDSLECALG